MSNEYKNDETTYSGSYTEPNQSGSYDTGNTNYDNSYQDPFGGSYENATARSYEQPDSPNGLGIASLVCGILALVTFCMCINIPLGIVSIVLGIIQIVKYEKKGMAIAGIVTSAISIIAFIVMSIAFGAIYMDALESGELTRIYEDIYDMQDENGDISDEELEEYLNNLYNDDGDDMYFEEHDGDEFHFDDEVIMDESNEL